MDLKRFEEMIVIAKRHNVEKFSCDGLSVQIKPEIADFPAIESDVEDEQPVFHEEKDPLLNTPMMR